MTQPPHRSLKREEERRELLMARLVQSPGLISAVTERLPQIVQVRRSIWKRGIEPLPFDEFCEALDGNRMFARQVAAFDGPNVLRAANMFSAQRTVTEWVLIWGKRCLAASELLRDERTGSVRSIQEWSRIGQPLDILTRRTDSTICSTRVDAPFRHGRAKIYAITLDDGREVHATAAHRLLTVQGWLPVSSCRAGLTAISALPLPANCGDHCRANCTVSCDARCTDDCRSYARVTRIEAEGEADYYDLHVPETHCYYGANGVLHHNSGKDYLFAKLNAWVAYVLNAFAVEPVGWMREQAMAIGKPFLASSGTVMNFINVAPTEDLSIGVFFQYLRRWLGNRELFGNLSFKLNAGSAVFRDVPVVIWAKSSSASGIDGPNTFFYLIDEADAFPRTEEHDQASEVHAILNATANTTFGPFAIGGVVTYPRTEDGFALRHRARGMRSPELYFVDLAGTGDIRPDFDINSPHIQEEYEHNPRVAAAMYECRAMSVEDAFIEMFHLVEAAIDTALMPCLQHDIYEHMVAPGIERIALRVSGIRPEPGRRYYIGGDAGRNHDSFTLVGVSVDATSSCSEWLCPACGIRPQNRRAGPYTQLMAPAADLVTMPECGLCGKSLQDYPIQWGTRYWWRRDGRESEVILSLGGCVYHIPRMREEFVIEVIPHTKRGVDDIDRPVDFPEMAAAGVQIAAGLYASAAGLDSYQSAHMLQMLQDAGIQANEVSMSNPVQMARGTLLRDMLYNQGLTLLDVPSQTRQIKKLRCIRGTRLDHTTTERKDIWDALSIAVWLAATSADSRLTVDWLQDIGAPTRCPDYGEEYHGPSF